VTVSGATLAVGLNSGTPTGRTYTFTATPSAASGTVPSGLTYAWDFDGNGTTDFIGPAATASYTYNAAGTYQPKVTITSPDGRTATNTITITVS
jgi:cytochrome c